MMTMREIWCSDEGDQGLNEGDFWKLQKGVLKRLIEVFNPVHSSGLSCTQSYNKYRIVHFWTLSCFDRQNLFKTMNFYLNIVKYLNKQGRH